jgi:predicted transcriptional regulator
MTTDNTVSEIIDTLGRRVDFLECVEEESKDKRTIADEFELSRSTLDRAVRELEALQLLSHGKDGYEPTVCGQLAAEEYRRLERRIEILCELQPFLRWVSPSSFDLELEWLADAELLLPEPGDPYAMVNRHVQLVNRSDSGKALLPVTGLHAHQAGAENVLERGGEFELIVTPDVARTLRDNQNYAELTEEMTETNCFDLFVYDGSIPYAVALLDDTVQIAADEDGEPRALLESNAPEVRNWAKRKIERYKRQATKLTGSTAERYPNQRTQSPN